jgi:RecA-family ATPase
MDDIIQFPDSKNQARPNYFSGLEDFDIQKAIEDAHPPLDFVIPGFLKGSIGCLVAPGGMGKSFLALETAIAVACEYPDGDILGLNPKNHGKVIYLAADDPREIINLRIQAIAERLSPLARESMKKHLVIKRIRGQQFDIMDERLLMDTCEFSYGSRLVIFDTLSRIHRLDENKNSDMGKLLCNFEYLSEWSGASLLLIHHTNKASASDGRLDQQQAARGASLIVDNARWGAYLVKMSEQEAKTYQEAGEGKPIGQKNMRHYLRFGVSKQNYGAHPTDIWLKRATGGVLLPVELTPIQTSKEGENNGKRVRNQQL